MSATRICPLCKGKTFRPCDAGGYMICECVDLSEDPGKRKNKRAPWQTLINATVRHAWSRLKLRYRQPMSEREHKARHAELHRALDELIADWVSHREGEDCTVFNTTIIELAQWSYQQTISPTSPRPRP